MVIKKIIGAVLVGFAGYEVYQYAQIARGLDLKITNFKLDVSGGALRVTSDLKITNSTSAVIPIESIRGRLGTTKGDFMSFSSKSKGKIPANGSLILHIGANITSANAIQALVAFQEKGYQKFNVSYRILARPTLLGIIPVPVYIKGNEWVNLGSYISMIKNVWDVIKANLKGKEAVSDG